MLNSLKTIKLLHCSYFDEHDDNACEYLPAPGSPGQQDKAKDDSDGEDPLDAFMAEIEVGRVKYLKIRTHCCTHSKP